MNGLWSHLARYVALGSVLASSACRKDEETAAANDGAAPSALAWFDDRAETAGLHFRHESGHRHRFLFPEIMGGGAALLDLEGDGDLDVYLVQSGRLVDGDTPPTSPPAGNQLFRNEGDGTFLDISEDSGADDRSYGIGVATGDYDGDGDLDLYVTNVGPNKLLRNDGDGTFTDVTETAGVGDERWSTSAGFLDYDADGDLDLFVVNYVLWSIDVELDCASGSGRPDYCSPKSYQAPAPETLYRNEGDGTFTDVSVDAGLRAAYGNGLGIVSADFNDDGLIDVFVANDQTPNQLWENQGDGTFEDVAPRVGCAVDERGEAKAGMGVTTDDIDDDGDLDLLIVNLEAQSDSFFRNEGGYFVDDTARVNLGVSSRRFTRFGMGFADFDNDGWLDLFQANGRVSLPTGPNPYRADDAFAEPNVLYQGQPGGRFEALPPLERIATSRAAAFGDLDNDGGMDIVVVNRDEAAYLLHNVHPSRGHWIMLDVRDDLDRPALGASVTLDVGPDRRVRREVRTAYSYCAANDPRVHVGLGDVDRAGDVRVRWPDGTAESFGDLEGDQIVTLRYGEGQAAE